MCAAFGQLDIVLSIDQLECCSSSSDDDIPSQNIIHCTETKPNMKVKEALESCIPKEVYSREHLV